MISDKIPYTEEMLSTIFRRKLNVVRLALDTFEQFGMIEIIDGVITIPNWGKHQTLDMIEERREYQRKYMAKKRAEQKQLASKPNCKPNSKSNSKTNVNPIEGEEDKNKKENKNRDIIVDDSIDYESIKTYFNSVCVDLPKIRDITDTRKRNIKNRIKEKSKDALKEAIDKSNASDFLSGRKTDWKATFDWIIKKQNFIKILEGNYDNKKKEMTTQDLDLNGENFWDM